MSRAKQIEQAIADCEHASRGASDLAHLRELIELPLIERLTGITTDRTVLNRTLDETLRRFASAVQSGQKIDWCAWLVATAMAIAVEETQQLFWVDNVARHVRAVDAHSSRMLVFFVILHMNGACQWALLGAVVHPTWESVGPAGCLDTLVEHLQGLA
jgi:hypothetical protein